MVCRHRNGGHRCRHTFFLTRETPAGLGKQETGRTEQSEAIRGGFHRHGQVLTLS